MDYRFRLAFIKRRGTIRAKCWQKPCLKCKKKPLKFAERALRPRVGWMKTPWRVTFKTIGGDFEKTLPKCAQQQYDCFIKWQNVLHAQMFCEHLWLHFSYYWFSKGSASHSNLKPQLFECQAAAVKILTP